MSMQMPLPDHSQGLFAHSWNDLYRREPVLVVFAAVLAAMMVPSFVGFFIDTRTFNGINVWIKPLKFQSSAALFLVTMALFWPVSRYRATGA